MLAALPIRNAHTIFSAVIQEIESVGSTVIPAHSFMDQYLPAPGVISSRAPLRRKNQMQVRHSLFKARERI